jgi:hypothetical protein
MSFSQELISSGALRSDQVARMLVPALMYKADKIHRGCEQRTATGQIDACGLHELGFALGGCFLEFSSWFYVFCILMYSLCVGCWLLLFAIV